MTFLFITDKYFPNPSINALCTQKIIDLLCLNGHKVDIITYKNFGAKNITMYNKTRVYYIRPDLKTSLKYYSQDHSESRISLLADKASKMLNRIKRLLLLPFFPLSSFTVVNRIIRCASKLIHLNHYDVIISVHQPFEGTFASMFLKKKHPEIFWCIYNLDTYRNLRFKSIEKFTNRINWELKFSSQSDLFLYIKSRENIYLSSEFNKYRYKMIATDIPLVSKMTFSDDFNSNDGKEIWVYAGSTGAPHYRIDDVVKIFMKLPNKATRELHFYGFASELEEVKRYQKRTNANIFVHGFLPHDKLLKVYERANILLSIKYSNQISAKVFEYISSGKRIVHISGSSSDPDAEYVAHYSNGIVLTPYKNTVDQCTAKLLDWLNKSNDYSRSDIDYSYYKMNTPEYTVDLLLKSIAEYKERL